jgi:hypothetical protein
MPRAPEHSHLLHYFRATVIQSEEHNDGLGMLVAGVENLDPEYGSWRTEFYVIG